MIFANIQVSVKVLRSSILIFCGFLKLPRNIAAPLADVPDSWTDDPPRPEPEAEDQDRDPQRRHHRRRGRLQDAPLLPLRGHRQCGLQGSDAKLELEMILHEV